MADILFETHYPPVIYLGTLTVKNLRVGESIVWPRTPTPSLSLQQSPGVTSSITPTQTPSLSISATPSLSISATPSLSISATRTPSLTPSLTPSSSLSSGYTDDFQSYSVGSLSGQGNWGNGLNTISISDIGGDKVVYSNTANSVTALTYDGNVADDQYSEITCDALVTGHFIGVMVRMSGNGATLCGYGYYGSPTTRRLFRIDDGVKTNLGNAGTSTQDDGAVFRLEVSGTTLTAYLNGSVDTEVGTNGSATVTEYTSGKTGITGYHNSGGTYGDVWKGGSL